MVLVLMCVVWPTQLHAQESSIGPFQIRDEAGHTLRVTGFAQLLAQVNGKESQYDNTILRVRRLRPGLSASLGHGLEFDAIWDLAPGSGQLIDAVATLDVKSHVKLQLGQFKTPWSRYRLTSGSDQVLVNWSHTTAYFGGERQLGLAVSRSDQSQGRLHYHLGVFSGNNARSSHGIGLAKVYKQPVENTSLFGKSSVSRDVHPELVGHVGVGSQGMDVARLDDPSGGGLRAYVGIGATHDFQPEAMYDADSRAQAEVIIKWSGFSTYTGVYAQRNALQQDDGRYGVMYGGLFESTYHVGTRTSLGIRASRMKLSDALLQDARLVSASSEVWHQLDEFALGARYQVLGENLVLTSDLGLNQAYVEDARQNSWRVRLQTQLSF